MYPTWQTECKHPTALYSVEIRQRGKETDITVALKLAHKNLNWGLLVLTLCWRTPGERSQKLHKIGVKVQQGQTHTHTHTRVWSPTMTSSFHNANQCKHTANGCSHKLQAKTQSEQDCRRRGHMDDLVKDSQRVREEGWQRKTGESRKEKLDVLKEKEEKKRRKDKIRKMSGNHKVWGKKTKSEEKL